MKKALALSFLAVLLAAPSLADGFDPNVVPARARRLVHIDVSGLQSSGLWKFFEQGEMNLDLDELNEFQEQFGIHPLKDIRSITLFDMGGELDHLTAVLVMSANADIALERLQQQESYNATAAGGLTVHSWEDNGETRYAYVHERGPDDRAVLLSDDADSLIGGLRVLTGGGPSLAQANEAGIHARPQPGTLFFAAIAGGMPEVGMRNRASAVLGRAKSVVLEIGSDDEFVFLRASMWTESVDEATQLLEIMQGARALARLLGGDEVPAELFDLLDEVNFNQRENEVRIDIELDLLLLAELAGKF